MKLYILMGIEDFEDLEEIEEELNIIDLDGKKFLEIELEKVTKALSKCVKNREKYIELLNLVELICLI
ncbi:MAG: hypothetical protein ACFFG0_56575 [Candidatus Thorarchaeota archaeon]